MSSHRQLRVKELLKRELAEAIRVEVPVEKAGLISVNDVELTNDLRQAHVLLGFLGTKEQEKNALNLLNAAKLRIQDHVAKTVILKYTPKLRFEMDDSIERGNRVLRVIEELEKGSTPGE